jgi:hypothetical protein
MATNRKRIARKPRQGGKARDSSRKEVRSTRRPRRPKRARQRKKPGTTPGP